MDPLKEITGVNRSVMTIDSSIASAVARLAARGGRGLSDPKPIYMRIAGARSGT